MSNNNKVGIPLFDIESGGVGEVGDVQSHIKIEKIELYSSSDQYSEPYDITLVVTELELSESMFSLAVVGSLTLVDNFNLFQDARIHGQEKIVIKFRRYNVETNTYDTTLEREFLVTNLREYRRWEFRAAYTLEFIAPHAYRDKTKRVSRAYGYTDMTAPTSDISGAAEAIQSWRDKYEKITVEYGDIFEKIGEQSVGGLAAENPDIQMEYPELFIYDILKRDLELETEDVWLYGYHPDFNFGGRTSDTKMKIVVPNWRPFQAIRWILRNTFSKNQNDLGDPWFCYDTLLAGVRIEPYSILIKSYQSDGQGDVADAELYSTGRPSKEMTGEYIYSSGFEADPESDEYFIQMHRRILDIQIGFSFDKFTKSGDGSYASQQWLADPITKYVIPNLLKFSDTTTISYDSLTGFTPGVDYYDGHSIPYAEFANEDNGQIDFKKTNYTYFIPYNSALHGTSEETYPYNKAFDFLEGYEEDPEYLGRIARTAEMKRKNISFMSHTIKVLGDFRLNPGMVVKLSIPKSVDPELLDEIDGMKETDKGEDEYLSGQYFVSECTHVFSEKTFHTYATVTRPSSTLDLG